MSRLHLFLVSSCVVFACSSNPDKPPAQKGPTVRFNAAAMPDFMEIPWPSDAYLVNGKIAPIPNLANVVHASAEYLSHELAKMNGFSRIAFTHYYVDDLAQPVMDEGPVAAAIDPSTLPKSEDECTKDTSAVFLIDVDAGKRLPCRASVSGWELSKTRPALSVGPARGLVLEPKHHYATVVTNRVKTKDGKAIAASADFQKLLSGDKSSPLANVYGPALDAIVKVVDKASIAGITAYTTHSQHEETYAARDLIETLPVPALSWSKTDLAPMGDARFSQMQDQKFTATLDDLFGVVDPKNKLPDGTDDPDDSLPVHAHDKIAALGTAVFQAANFLVNKPGGYQDLDHATFAHDAQGKPIVSPDKPTNKIWVTFAVPNTPMPPNGYPVVIIQHGLSSSRAYMAAFANTFCKKGWAVAAIDSITFGARAPGAEWQVDMHTDWEKAPGAKYAGPDGLGDASGTGERNGSNDLFGMLKNIGALRDQLRQAALDTAQLVRVLKASPSLDPLATSNTIPKLDGTHIAYVGDSLGGIEGAAASALEPNLAAWVLNVAGGGLIQELGVRAPGIYPLLSLAASFNFGFYNDQLTEAHPIVGIIQTIAELGDPLLYARHIVTNPMPLSGMPTKPRNVLQISVIFDELVTNESNEALARAAGFGFAKPNVGPNAELFDFKQPARGVPLVEAAPDGNGLIHDVPLQGTTAVLVQDSPAGHGYNIASSTALRQFKAPYALFGTGSPFVRLDEKSQYRVKTGYRELQATIVRFIEDAFLGKTPNVAITRAPVRDIDGDGSPDATDPDPNNPNVK